MHTWTGDDSWKIGIAEEAGEAEKFHDHNICQQPFAFYDAKLSQGTTK